MKVVRYPHPALVHPTRPLTSIDKKVQLHVGQMIDTMYEAKGLGLAANQVALPFQILIMNISGDSEQKEHEHVYLNPVIVERKGVQEGDEGCLSFPELFQKVRRAKTVTVKAYNLQGEPVEVVAHDLEARCWQHEIDHLNGIVFIDKMGPLARLSARNAVKDFERQFREAQKRGEIPADAEIEKYLRQLEEEMRRGEQEPPHGVPRA